MRCNNCGIENDSVSKYCKKCGVKLNNYTEEKPSCDQDDFFPRKNKKRKKLIIAILSAFLFIVAFCCAFVFLDYSEIIEFGLCKNLGI